MSRIHTFLLTAAAVATVHALLPLPRAAGGEVRMHVEGTNTYIQVRGDKDDDWRIQTSDDMLTWTNAAGLTTLLSGDGDAPLRSIGACDSSQRFYRALKTDGLYDITLLRSISLTFTQSNWQSLLTTGRTTGSNTLANLIMDNGAAIGGVGVRYRGNTSFTGLGGGGAPTKKSVNIDINYTNETSDLMGYKTVNLNNAYGDETVMRESIYFHTMQHYTVCPQASLAKLYINGDYWGVYSFAQQENGDLIKDWFPSNAGDRWRAPNMPAGGGGGGGPGGGGTSGSGNSALAYLGASIATYQSNYELKTDNSTNAWERLLHATDVLNNTASTELRDKVEDVLAVDRWLWFLAIENIFADDDSYFNKGADYEFYYEPESGRIHPVEHDGNEAFVAGDTQLSPVEGATSAARPVLYKLLPIAELRQRYLAHMRTVLQEWFNPTALTPLIDGLSALSLEAIVADTKKGYTMTAYNTDLAAVKTFVASRYKFLTNHAELKPVPPTIVAVYGPATAPSATETPFVTAEVRSNGTDGVSSVWLYYRSRSYGRFVTGQMFDDGAHGDGTAGDGIFGGATTNFPAGTKVRFYIEARSANTAKAASYSPARAEEVTYHYRVGLTTATNTPVVLNELMAANSTVLADPQGDYDDWIELHNITDQEVDLSGHYLTDEPNNPRKWAFPADTRIPADGYLLVWADENGADTPGLHASFKLDSSGESVYLIDTDARLNVVLDAVTFGAQETDRSFGRAGNDSDVWSVMEPTPGASNR